MFENLTEELAAKIKAVVSILGSFSEEEINPIYEVIEAANPIDAANTEFGTPGDPFFNRIGHIKFKDSEDKEHLLLIQGITESTVVLLYDEHEYTVFGDFITPDDQYAQLIKDFLVNTL